MPAFENNEIINIIIKAIYLNSSTNSSEYHSSRCIEAEMPACCSN